MIYAAFREVDPEGLAGRVRRLEQDGIISGLHLDVVDARFSSRPEFEPATVRELRKHTELPIEVHVFSEHPLPLALRFFHAGAQRAVFQAELCPRLHEAVALARECGLPAGVAFHDTTAFQKLDAPLAQLEYLSMMSADSSKTADFRRFLQAAGSRAQLGIEGGVGVENAARFFLAGADDLIIEAAVLEKPGAVGVCA